MVDRTRKLGDGWGVRKHYSDWQRLSTLLLRQGHRVEDAGSGQAWRPEAAHLLRVLWFG